MQMLSNISIHHVYEVGVGFHLRAKFKFVAHGVQKMISYAVGLQCLQE